MLSYNCTVASHFPLSNSKSIRYKRENGIEAEWIPTVKNKSDPRHSMVIFYPINMTNATLLNTFRLRVSVLLVHVCTQIPLWYSECLKHLQHFEVLRVLSSINRSRPSLGPNELRASRPYGIVNRFWAYCLPPLVMMTTDPFLTNHLNR